MYYKSFYQLVKAFTIYIFFNNTSINLFLFDRPISKIRSRTNTLSQHFICNPPLVKFFLCLIISYNKTKILSIVTNKKPEQNFQIGIFYTPIQNVPCFFLRPLYFVFVPSRSNGVFVQLEQVLSQSLV